MFPKSFVHNIFPAIKARCFCLFFLLWFTACLILKHYILNFCLYWADWDLTLLVFNSASFSPSQALISFRSSQNVFTPLFLQSRVHMYTGRFIFKLYLLFFIFKNNSILSLYLFTSLMLEATVSHSTIAPQLSVCAHFYLLPYNCNIILYRIFK